MTMDVAALFKGLQNLFGESHYDDMTKDLQPNYWRTYAYRNSFRVCIDRGAQRFPTDQDIIKSHLSKLTHDELNAIDSNGASILHLAVQYNRCGQNGYTNPYKETHKNSSSGYFIILHSIREVRLEHSVLKNMSMVFFSVDYMEFQETHSTLRLPHNSQEIFNSVVKILGGN